MQVRPKAIPLERNIENKMHWQRASGVFAQRMQTGALSSARASGQLSRSVDRQNGIDAASVAALIKAARKIIISARGALF